MTAAATGMELSDCDKKCIKKFADIYINKRKHLSHSM